MRRKEEGTLTPILDKARVWIIDRQQWPRALLRAELIERSYEAIGFAGVGEALGALRKGLYERPMLVILEMKDLREGDERLRALARLRIPTLYLLGAAEEARALSLGLSAAALLRRPFTIGRLTEEVEKRLKSEGEEAVKSKRPNPNAE